MVNSESETMMVSMVRQPDSETFRFWEMAGTAHGGGESAEAMTAVLVRDGISEGLPIVEGRNTIAWDYIARAGLERLVEWIDTKTPPVSIPPSRSVRLALHMTRSGTLSAACACPTSSLPLRFTRA